MSPSHYLPTVAFAVAVGSLFAPPLIGAMGVAAPSAAPRESALVIETQPAARNLASLEGPMTRVQARTLQARQCEPAEAAARAPLPPALRTVVADLAPALR